jgi:hypothetical protein
MDGEGEGRVIGTSGWFEFEIYCQEFEKKIEFYKKISFLEFFKS